MDPERAIFSEIAWRPDWQGCMVRWRNWKYCWYPNGDAELYDLSSDPGENVSLATDASASSVRDALHERLVAFWEPDHLEERRNTLPRLKENKGDHVAMQYVLCDGTWVDAWP